MSTPANPERLLTREELADWKGDLVVCKFPPDGKEARALATIERMAAALKHTEGCMKQVCKECDGASALLREYEGGSDV